MTDIKTHARSRLTLYPPPKGWCHESTASSETGGVLVHDAVEALVHRTERRGNRILDGGDVFALVGHGTVVEVSSLVECDRHHASPVMDPL